MRTKIMRTKNRGHRVTLRRITQIALAFALTAGLAFGSAESKAASDKPPIIIGAAIALSGFMELSDGQPFQGFKLKIDQVNAAGGINGRMIEIIVENTNSEKTQTRTVAESLIEKGAELMVVTCNFDFGAPAAQVAQEHNMVNITLCAASPRYGVQGIGPQAYSPAPATYYEGHIMAEFIKKSGWTKPYILTDQGLDYSREICDGFKTHWTANLGGTLAGEDKFQNNQTSIATQIANILASDADSIAICTYSPGGPVALRQIRAAGIDLPIVTDLAMTGTYWVNAVPGISNFFTTANASVTGDDPDPKINQFVKDFTAAYGPTDLDYSTEGYTAAEVMVLALERTGGNTDGIALSKEIDSMTDEPTLLVTTYTTNVHINASRPLRILEYVNGVPQYHDTLVSSVPPDLKLGLSN